MHVHVADRERAAAWYADVLGFTIVEKYRAWGEDPGGPLTIADATGRIHLALFATEAPRHDVLAFGVTGEEFVAWRRHLVDRGLDVRYADHQQALSLYFLDGDGNTLEITTYDVEVAPLVEPR